ncbi:MAG: DNA primase [Arenicellales bacterium]|nr:DNA primase [Arenicellales bacterium]
MPGRIPQSFVDDLITRTDIVDIIDSRVPLKKAGSEYKACCPFHDEKTPSFTVSPTKQFYHCFGCSAHGTVIGFLMEFEHMEFVEAVEYLASRLGLEVPREGESAPAKKKTETADIFTVLDESASYYQQQLRHHSQANEAIDYLKQRGLTGEISAHFGLGYAPPGWDNLLRHLTNKKYQHNLLLQAGLITRKSENRHYDRFRNRIMFPIQNHRGQVIGFGGRALGDEEPKYLNSPETPVFHKGSELYGLYRARPHIKEAGKALVVEGYMDVVALSQFELNNSVATLGTATTRTQLERLFRHTDEVVFCFDGDRAGREAAWRALETALPCLREGRQISFLFLPQGEDPDSVVRAEGKTGFEAKLANAVPLPDYLLQQLSASSDLSRIDGRARFIELAKPMLQKVPDGAFRELMLNRVAQLAQIDRETLNRTLPSPESVPKKPIIDSGLVRKSLVRLGLSLLIQRPHLAKKAGDVSELQHLELPGIQLFIEITQLAQQHPDMTSAALLERYRGTEYHKHLEKLAVWDHMITTEDLDQEFDAVMRQLKERWMSQQATQLLHKTHLSESEKSKLRELLQNRRSK